MTDSPLVLLDSHWTDTRALWVGDIWYLLCVLCPTVSDWAISQYTPSTMVCYGWSIHYAGPSAHLADEITHIVSVVSATNKPGNLIRYVKCEFAIVYSWADFDDRHRKFMTRITMLLLYLDGYLYFLLISVIEGGWLLSYRAVFLHLEYAPISSSQPLRSISHIP